jgi:hypothetical protein
MTPRGLRLVFLLMVASVLVTVGFATSPAIAAGPYTSWIMRADGAGADILGSGSYAYDGSSGIQVLGDAKSVHASVAGFTLDVHGPGSGALVPGQTYTAVPSYSGDTGNPSVPVDPAAAGLTLAGNGQTCDVSTSTVTVHELTVGLTGQVTSLNLSFVHLCRGGPNAARGSLAWNSATPADPVPPRLSISLPTTGKEVKYHHNLVIDVQVSADSVVRNVGLYYTPVGGGEQLVKQATIDAKGFAQIWFRPTESGTLSVRIAGGGLFPDRESRRYIAVEAEIDSRLRGASRHDGDYSLYPSSKSAVILAQLLPEHPGSCLGFRAQFRVRGHWGYDGVVKCVHLDKHSVAGIRLPGDRRLVGVPIRMRAEFRGDDRARKAHGEWQHLRFI